MLTILHPGGFSGSIENQKYMSKGHFLPHKTLPWKAGTIVSGIAREYVP
jgi:hypothetical protein